MRPEVIYPLIAMALTAISIGGTMFFNRHNAKRGDVETLQKELIDVRDRLTKCELARETLTADRISILEKVALQTLASLPNNQLTTPVETIKSPQVEVKAVK